MRGPDTDGDGLPDFLELRFGTAPDLDDVLDDQDWDVVPNGEEVRAGTDPDHAAEEGRFDGAVRYKLEALPWEPGRTCYAFEVSNLTLVELAEGPEGEPATGPAGQGWTGNNRILVLTGLVPFDDQDSIPSYQVACVEATVREEGNYRNPPSGRMALGLEDFVPLASFDPATHCVLPGVAP